MRTASIIIVALSAVLAGCTSAVEEFLHEPQGTYAYYHCELLEQLVRDYTRRENELRHMMDGAAAEPGGAVAISLSFRSEYSKTRAHKKHMLELMQQKNCKTDSLWSSEREVR
jgi:hypothetical protein